MSIKAGANNNFGALKWFGCFVKDENLLDEAMAWSYDVKQLAVNAAGHLNMPSSLPDIQVITNPYNTSAALVSAVSGAFKYQTYYDDGTNGDVSAVLSGDVDKYGLYAEASAFASSVAATSYYHFPFVPSGDWLHYAKGKTNYRLAASSTFERWTSNSGEVNSVVLPDFSATSGNPHFFATSAEAFQASSSEHGVNWVDNFPRTLDSNSAATEQECKCCLAWKISSKGGGVLSVGKRTFTGHSTQYWLKLNISVSMDMARRIGCDDPCGEAMKAVGITGVSTPGAGGPPTATGGASTSSKPGASISRVSFSNSNSEVTKLPHLNCGGGSSQSPGQPINARQSKYLNYTDTSSTGMTPYETAGNCYGDSKDSDKSGGLSSEAIMGGSTSAGPMMSAQELMSKCGMTKEQINYPVYGTSKTKGVMQNIMHHPESRTAVEGIVDAAIQSAIGDVMDSEYARCKC